MPADYYPVLIGLGVAFVLGAVLMSLSWLLGDRTGGRIKLSPYESGQPLLDHSRKRISVVFFLVAIDFVVFDVEAAFLYPWVLVLREGAWPLFWAVMAFIGLVVLGLVYIWRKGGLDIEPRYLPDVRAGMRSEESRVGSGGRETGGSGGAREAEALQAAGGAG